jgi:hypothetical protein
MRTELSNTALVSIAVLGLAAACDRAVTPVAQTGATKRSSALYSLSASGAGEMEHVCTNAGLEGAYGFYRTGTTGAGPFAAVGLATYDGAGNWSATQTISRGGVFTRDVMSSGQYQVSADCSGKLFSDGQEVAHFALADRGQQLFILSVIPGETVRGIENRVAQRGCTIASLEGTYGFFRAGTIPAGPLAAVGIATYDGTGNSTATQTISRNGTIVPGGQPASYEVSGDCTGRLIAANGQEFARFVVVERGNEIFQISLTAGNAVTGVQRKVARGQDEQHED